MHQEYQLWNLEEARARIKARSRYRRFDRTRREAEELLKTYQQMPELLVHHEVLKELLQISLNDPRQGKQRSPYLDQYDRTRELGELLHELGGWHLMSWGCQSCPRYDRSEVEVAWDGIGDWGV